VNESKKWYQSRAMVAGYGAIGLWLVVFLVALFTEADASVKSAAQTALEVLALISPVLGGLAVAGIRGAKKSIGVALVVVLAVGVMACSTPGTGARTDPQTGTSTVGAQTFSGRTQAGATYVIKSEGTVYNIDTDGSPKSKAAAEAIASSLLKYDETIDALNKSLLDPDLPAEAKATVLDSLKWVTEEKRLFMAEAKGAFGVSINITGEGEGHGSSTVDTTGATGEQGVPPVKDPDGDGD